MKANRIFFAVVASLGITSLALLSMRFTIFGFLLTAPGWLFAILFAAVSYSDSFLVLPISTFLAYAGLILLVVSVRMQNVTGQRWRKWTLWSSPGVIVLVVLACVPTLDPLLPHGMKALRKREAALASKIQDGDHISDVTSVLKSQKVVFTNDVQLSDGIVFSRGDVSIRASRGDVVLSNFATNRANPNGDAYQFPCRYDLFAVFVFGKDEKLKQHYIGDYRLCL